MQGKGKMKEADGTIWKGEFKNNEKVE